MAYVRGSFPNPTRSLLLHVKSCYISDSAKQIESFALNLLFVLSFQNSSYTSSCFAFQTKVVPVCFQNILSFMCMRFNHLFVALVRSLWLYSSVSQHFLYFPCLHQTFAELSRSLRKVSLRKNEKRFLEC